MKRFKKRKRGDNLTDAEQENLSGPVKQMMITTYKAHLKAGSVVQGKIEIDYSGADKNQILTFNPQGTKIENRRFGSYGNETETYDGETKRRIQTFNFDTTGKLQRTSTYYYDDQGKNLGHLTLNADGSLYSRIVEKYDEKGNHIEHIHSHGVPERVIARTVTTYNEKGKRLTSTDYDAKGEIRVTTESKYDDRGNSIEYHYKHHEKGNSKYDQWHKNKYNEHNDCIEAVYYHADGSIKDAFTYNYEYDADGKKIIKPHPEYDPFALKPGETEEIEYDRYENQIKRTTFYNKLPVNIFVYDYVYHDDADQKVLTHPLENIENRKAETTEEAKEEDEFSEEDAKWFADIPGFTADNFPAARYYLLRYHDAPSLVTYTGPNIEALTLLKELKENMGAEEIHSYSTVWNNYGEKMLRYTLRFRSYPYLLQAIGLSGHNEDEFEVPDFVEVQFDNFVYISQFQLFLPSEASSRRDTFFEEELNEYIAKCTLEKTPDKPVINMIEVSGNSFVMREHPVDDDFEIDDLDVNYGYGFEEFHEELMVRFSTSTKGLVLFHGEPGTGKTYYIRHLLRSMAMNKKVVIYMPPNMVDHLVEPGFMTFLTEEIKTWSEDGNFCVMLIEDAEPLLAKRQEGVRIQGITNLLNMTDGILNDMLNLQVICTFNVGLRKLDSALLRPGRLIARKEFKALSELDANLLAQRIGIKHHFKGPATLGEIYAKRKDQSILVHDVDSGENSSTDIDDLI